MLGRVFTLSLFKEGGGFLGVFPFDSSQNGQSAPTEIDSQKFKSLYVPAPFLAKRDTRGHQSIQSDFRRCVWGGWDFRGLVGG